MTTNRTYEKKKLHISRYIHSDQHGTIKENLFSILFMPDWSKPVLLLCISPIYTGKKICITFNRTKEEKLYTWRRRKERKKIRNKHMLNFEPYIFSTFCSWCYTQHSSNPEAYGLVKGDIWLIATLLQPKKVFVSHLSDNRKAHKHEKYTFITI